MAENEKKTNRFVKFFRDLKSERKKVTWPTAKETTKQTGVVIVELVAVAAIVGILDLAFSKLFMWLAQVI